jgi:hypothetical protein
MHAREYFALLDAITAAAGPELPALRTRLAATEMHPLERRALERAARARELALDADAEVRRGPARRGD